MLSKKVNKRTQQGLETRQKIFEVAVRLFSTKGYDRVTVDDICIEAGVTKGAFYNHFESKDSIIMEQFAEYEVHLQNFASLHTVFEDEIERIKAFNRYSIEYIASMGADFIRVVYFSQLDPGKKTVTPAMNRRRPLYKISEKMVREAQRQGLLRKDIDARTITEIALQAQRGLIFEWCLARGQFDLLASSEEMMNILLDGLKVNRDS